eukprot:COSAG04_NODE_21114_length_379_cov_1.839286_2_plen_30_part_01
MKLLPGDAPPAAAGSAPPAASAAALSQTEQ